MATPFTPAPEPIETNPSDQVDELAGDDDATQAAVDLDRLDMRYLKEVVAVLSELRTMDAGGDQSADKLSSRVQFARDRAQVAIFERLCRIARRDLPAVQA